MVTFILGNSIKKRKEYASKANEENVYIDDMRLSADTVKNGIYYYSIGKRPFVNMQVRDFVSYSRILFDGQAKESKKIKSLLRSLGYNSLVSKKIGKLNSKDYIKVLLASKIKDTTKNIYINLDGWEYNKRNQGRLNSIASYLKQYSLFFLVSDFRFCEVGANAIYQNQDGSSFCIDCEKKRKRVAKGRVLSMIKTGRVA